LLQHISSLTSYFFFFTIPPPTSIYTLSLHDALPILDPLHQLLHAADHRSRVDSDRAVLRGRLDDQREFDVVGVVELPLVGRRIRSEEHTSELQSPYDLVCRLLLEKKKKQRHHLVHPV